MANRFQGSYRRVAERVKRGNGSYMPRGILRMVRVEKQLEAASRNVATPHERTKAHRLNRCNH